MYRIYLDNNLIYDNHTPELSVSDATLELLQNDISTFQFTIYPNNPYINKVSRMVSRVTVYRDSTLMFSGLVCDDEVGFMNQRMIKCKSDMYYLTRTIVREYEFSGGVKEYFTMLIDEHNTHSEFKFTVGNITVTDPNDYITRSSSGLPSTWNELNDKCLKLLGGYVSLRYADGKTYIDYLADYETVSPQTIEFGKNLLEAKREASGLDIATVLIPLGASYEVTSNNSSNDESSSDDDSADTSATDTTTESKRVDITSVNDGKNYIENEDGIARYGRIEKTNTWDDVHEPAILLRKAKAYLDDLIYHKMTITVSAVDLANINKIDSFSMKQYIHVVSKPNGIDDVYLPMKMSINILDASQNKIELSVASQTNEKSEVSRTQSSGLVEQIITTENNTKNNINKTVEGYSTKINQQKDSISTEVARTKKEMIDYTDKSLNDYYTKDETVSRISQEADRVNSPISKVQSALVGTVNRLVELNRITAKTKPSDDSVIKFESNNLKLGYVSDGAFELYKSENFTGLYNDSKTHSLLAVVRTEDNSSQSITIKAGNRTSTAKIDGDYTRITIDSISFNGNKSISVSCSSGVYLCFDKLRLIEADRYVDIAEGITSLTNSVTQTQGTVEFISSQLDTLKSDIDGASETSERIKKYVIFNEDKDDASLTLCTSRDASGKPTGFTMKLTPKALNFYQNYGDTEPIAYLTNSNLYITKAVVVQSYRVGHHIWTATKTDLGEDMLVLDYIGGGA